MKMTDALKKELLKRVYYEQPISGKPMNDGFAICLLNRECNVDEMEYLKYWLIDNKQTLKTIENELNSIGKKTAAV